MHRDHQLVRSYYSLLFMKTLVWSVKLLTIYFYACELMPTLLFFDWRIRFLPGVTEMYLIASQDICTMYRDSSSSKIFTNSPEISVKFNDQSSSEGLYRRIFGFFGFNYKSLESWNILYFHLLVVAGNQMSFIWKKVFQEWRKCFGVDGTCRWSNLWSIDLE